MKKVILQIVLVGIFLVIGIMIALFLQKSRRVPEKKERLVFAPLVEVQRVRRQDIPVIVPGSGTVQAKIQLQIIPQVSGKIIALHPHFLRGGFFRSGETLLTIDPKDYELAVQRAQAIVARARVKLDLEKAEAEVARKEWEQLNPNQEPPSPLIIRKPQIMQAQAELEASKAELATARLHLERTKIAVPFDGRIVKENVDIGQYILPGQSIATVYSTGAVEIPVPLEDTELSWFDIPAEAEVTTIFAGKRHKWTGHVVRTEGQIDPTTRLVSVVVEVENPVKRIDTGYFLIPGMYVEVTIKGEMITRVIPVQRSAIHMHNQVWTISEGDRLHIQEVTIIRRDRNFVYITSGLEEGAMIITSSLDAVTEGMKVRTLEDNSKDREKNMKGS